MKRFWTALATGWQALGRLDADDIAAARAAEESGDPGKRRRRFMLPERQTAIAVMAIALIVLLLLLLRCCTRPHPATAPVAMAAAAEAAAGAPVCDGLLEHDAWTGTIAFKHKRDVTNDKGTYRLQYEYEVDLGAEMKEITRRQFRDRDSLVQVFSPEPRGRIKAEQLVQGFDRLGLSSSSRFAATGGLQKYEKGMAEDGSMMSLTLNDDCTYRFFLQGQALGEWTTHDRYDGTKSSGGMLWIPGVHGDGVAANGSRLSGSADYPLMSARHIETLRNQPGWINFVGELDKVEEILGRENLGTVTVSWNFEARD